ncbi:transposase [Bacillus sp. EB600]|nr:RNA-guided endonuclease TnpB family protein [Bacillus sp. EB600]MCQ6281202.1 transposase [Bacillus sp. EB600]
MFPQFGVNEKGNRMAMSFSDSGKLFNKRLGEIDLLLHRPLDGIIKQLIIKRQGKRWYAIFSVERQALPASIDTNNAIGIDVGLNKYAVLSNGSQYDNPRFLRKKEKQLKKAQHKLSKKKKGSANYTKQVQRVRKFHEKVANQRKDFLHKLSFNLTEDYSVIAVENLNIQTWSETGNYLNLFPTLVGVCSETCLLINVKEMVVCLSRWNQNSLLKIALVVTIE